MMINGKEWDDGSIVITICGVVIHGIKSFTYTEPENKNDLQYNYDLMPMWPPKRKRRFEPSIIEVIALGKHNNN